MDAVEDDQTMGLIGAVGKAIARLLLVLLALCGICSCAGGAHWLALATLPVPVGNTQDSMAGPPDNPGWRRNIESPVAAAEILNLYLIELPKRGWKLEWKALNIVGSEVYCIRGEHLLFPTIYVEILNKTTRVGARLAIRTYLKSTVCEEHI